MAGGGRSISFAVSTLTLALLFTNSAAQGQDVYFSTIRLREACSNISTAKTWTDRFNAGQVKPDEIGTMGSAWSDARACYAYLWGYMHGSAAAQTRSERPSVCYPDGLTGDQLAAVFLAWADANPIKWHLQPSATVGFAFETAWPCGSSPSKPASEGR
jgi:Rap1a immunity proteins